MRPILPSLAAAAVLAASPAFAQPASELSVSAEYQEGDYGTGESIETLTLQTRLQVETGRFFFYGTLPWQRIEAPGNVVGGGGGLLGLPIVIDPTRPAARDAREGIGDLRVGGGVRAAAPAGIDVALIGEVKLPTAADGLGTGEADFSIGAEASRAIGPVTPFAALSYTMPGDPQGYELRDSFAARGGISAQLSRGVRGMLAYGYAQSLSPLVPDEQQLSTALEIGLSQRLSLGLHGSAGLSEGSPDVGASVRLGWRLF